MFKNCLGMMLIGLLMFIVVVGFMLLVAYGLNYLFMSGVIPCELYSYIITGLLLGIFMLVGLLLVNPKIDLNKIFGKEKLDCCE